VGPVRARDLPTWRQAWSEALYGPDGFFRRERPADHFRTSSQASPLFAGAMLTLLRRTGLTAVTDIGAGGGELLANLHALAPGELDLLGVDLAPRPPGLPAAVRWVNEFSGELDGLVVANEWLDNLPCDVVQADASGAPRYLHVDPRTGDEVLGEQCHEPWLRSWWPVDRPGHRAEIGSSRDRAWADVVRRLRRGVAIAVDYGHTAASRPAFGSLAAYRHGQRVEVVPDGTCDITAHVAVDSLHGERTTQREALRALGVDASRPPLEQAHTQPGRYLEALNQAGEATELTDPAGLGGFCWVVVTRGVDTDLPLEPVSG
jgi:Putative S-adenosyl-L-methionine-dependent methyltransferase